MGDIYTSSLKKLIEEFGKLPGIGTKTAQRLAFYILNASQTEAMALAEPITAAIEDGDLVAAAEWKLTAEEVTEVEAIP